MTFKTEKPIKYDHPASYFQSKPVMFFEFVEPVDIDPKFSIGVCGKTLDKPHCMVPCKTKSLSEVRHGWTFPKVACNTVQAQIDVTALGSFGATSGKFGDFH